MVIYGLHVTRHDQAVHWSDLCYEHIVGLLYFAAFCCQFVSFDFYLYIFILHIKHIPFAGSAVIKKKKKDYPEVAYEQIS